MLDMIAQKYASFSNSQLYVATTLWRGSLNAKQSWCFWDFNASTSLNIKVVFKKAWGLVVNIYHELLLIRCSALFKKFIFRDVKIYRNV